MLKSKKKKFSVLFLLLLLIGQVYSPRVYANGEISVKVNGPVSVGQKTTVELNLPDEDFDLIYIDARPIGGPKRILVSKELEEVTITVAPNTKSGVYELPIKAEAADNKYETTVSVTVEEASNDLAFDEQIIYFMLTDRFYDGDPSNNNPYNLPYDKAVNKRGTYQGGDFKGITKKLDYLEELGVTAIWITPIVENIRHNVAGDGEKEYYGYHGYWALDFTKLNPHLGTLSDFHELIDEAAKRDIRIIVDVVLNHTGYDLETDASTAKSAPTDEERGVFNGMLRTKEDTIPNDAIKSSLSGLPDLLTEKQEVREKIVSWQTDWLDISTTKEGNSIYGYRVDTVKHVEPTTWQHFKNELVKKNPNFQLIGEVWGASYAQSSVYLNSSMMDSVLDFGFKDIAKTLANGNITSAIEQIEKRDEFLSANNTNILGQFLSSHDETGFLYSVLNDKSKQKVAATLQLTSKGQPVIYYGEELGQTGANNWPEYDNRYDFLWDKVEDNDMLDHYKKLIAFRKNNSKLLARGNHNTLIASNEDKITLYERSLDEEKVWIGINVSDEAKSVQIEFEEETKLYDAYSSNSYSTKEKDGKHILEVTIPSKLEGGTLLLEE